MKARELNIKISFIPFFIAFLAFAAIRVVLWPSLSLWIVFIPLMIVGVLIGFALLFIVAILFAKWLQE